MKRIALSCGWFGHFCSQVTKRNPRATRSKKELVMRRMIMTGAVAVFTATALAASATEVGRPAPAVRSAQVNVVQDVPYVCGWWGRQCWTIGYAYYYRPYY